MSTNLFTWLKQNLLGQTSCESCLKLLELVTDGEASPEEEKHFNDHINECLPCFESFNLEKSIKEMLQTRLDKKQVPDDLIKSIKQKIRNTA